MTKKVFKQNEQAFRSVLLAGGTIQIWYPLAKFIGARESYNDFEVTFDMFKQSAVYLSKKTSLKVFFNYNGAYHVFDYKNNLHSEFLK
jgi:hypothetical protein